MTAVASLFVDTSPQQEPLRAKRLPPAALCTPEQRAVRYLQTVDPVANVLAVVRRRSGLINAELFGKDRHERVAFFRHIAAWLMRQYGLSFPEIGREIGRRDHTTMMSSVRRIDGFRDTDPKVRALTDELLVELDLLASGPRPPTTLPMIPDLLPERGAEPTEGQEST